MQFCIVLDWQGRTWSRYLFHKLEETAGKNFDLYGTFEGGAPRENGQFVRGIRPIVSASDGVSSRVGDLRSLKRNVRFSFARCVQRGLSCGS